MPIPEKREKEDKQEFVARCMGSEIMKKDYPDNKQRIAVCLSQSTKTKSSFFDQVLDILGFSLSYNDCESCGDSEEITSSNIIIPKNTDYLDYHDTDTEEIDAELIIAKYEYEDPVTHEVFYFNKIGNYKKNNRYLVFQGKASEYQNRKVTLNKPFRTPKGPKKFSVYVKNEKGNVVKVNFGDPNMKIKKYIPERRKSFRARHNCDNPGPKWKARYWSCKAW